MKNIVTRSFRIKKLRIFLFLILFLLSSFQGRAGDRLSLNPNSLNPSPVTDTPSPLNLDDIILDIYNAVTEFGEVDYEQLQTDLYALHDAPIDLNHTSDEELSQLYFLSPRQIDDLLAYADKHPFESLYELRMIQSLTDYEIRNLLPFVSLNPNSLNLNRMHAREVFAHASHEIITRVDVRNIEDFDGTDPVYVQTRYRFDYQRRVTFGAQLRRPAGTGAEELQYGAYLQLRDIGHLHTLVAGNFQASFGQGLVLAPVFHTGKSAYIQSVGQTTEGLRYYSSVDGEGLHGAGATLRREWNKKTRLDVSALYSLKRANDSIWHHLVGANITVRHKRLQVQLTAIENIWSDSIRPYRNTAYNRHYFRGTNQAVVSASARYNRGWFDLFGEFAASENSKPSTLNPKRRKPLWGFGTIIGSRFYPASGISLIALYRYYSPWFDNALGYAFSETSRLGDENGGYLGWDITRWRNWRWSGYADVFHFTGPKYGIPDSPTTGYDVMTELLYHKSLTPSPVTGNPSPLTPQPSTLNLLFRIRARKKGEPSTYSARLQIDWQRGGWSLRTTAEANITQDSLSLVGQSTAHPFRDGSGVGYGYTVSQDISYSLPSREGLGLGSPLTLRVRLQAFDAREWANRIYMYEHDVLYAFSVPAIYGLGGRAYLCIKWQIIPQLALYFRASETVYTKQWAADHSRPQTRTDLHLLLRAKF